MMSLQQMTLIVAAASLVGGCATAPVACPDGTVVVGAAPPAGDLRYCVRAAGEVQPIRHGPWQRWHGSRGALAEEGAWASGRKDGLWRRFDREGRALEEATYRAGIPDGPWRRWYEDGQVAEEGSYAAGRREGRWRTWYRTGQLRSDGGFRADRRDGAWTLFFSDGTKQAEGRFQLGARALGWREWQRDGAPRDNPVVVACEALIERICKRVPAECAALRARLDKAVDAGLTPSSMDQCRQVISDDGALDLQRAGAAQGAGPR